MFTGKNVKKFVIIFLIISLIYANLSTTILGVISYAQEDTVVTEPKGEEESKPLKVEISDFTKNEMAEKETEYQEKITLTPNREKSFEKVTISDIETFVGREIIDNEEENVNSINTFYRTTKIDKLQLLDSMGIDGKLDIYYEAQETENNSNEIENDEQSSENDEENQEAEIPIGTIMAKDGKATIDKETETDEKGYITIVYPEKTTAVKIELIGQIEKIETIEFVNNKSIEIVNDIDMVQIIKATKQINFENNNELVSNTETTAKNIYYSKTLAELGIDKNQITTGVENKLSFTITLHTENEMLDLYTNPTFVIELPKELKNINIDEAFVLNNVCFEDSSIDIGISENGDKFIIIKLSGTQTEYTKSLQENMQIALSARVETDGFMPTTLSKITLHYQNENAKTYNGIEAEERGTQIIPIELVSNKEVMVETKLALGEQEISSRENSETIVIAPNSYQTVTVKGNAINNVGTDIQNVAILGTATNLGEIVSEYKVYYTENENATIDLSDENNKWNESYLPNANKYLIVIDEFKQSQEVSFEYDVRLQQNIEEDIMHEASFEVYNNENQVINVSKIEALQEAQKSNMYEDNIIKANIVCSNTENIEIGDYVDCGVIVENISNEEIKNTSIKVTMPENFEKAITMLTINGEQIDTPRVTADNEIQIQDINLKAGETLLLAIRIKVLDYVNKVENFKANIVCNSQESIEIFERLSIVEKSQIETTITSNKVGQKLEPTEDIEYKATIKNTGKSHAIIDITTALPETMNVIKIKIINQNSGETRAISGNGLKNGISRININPDETIEVYVKGIVKDIEQDDYTEMYINITGDKIVETTTNEVINKIHKKQEVSKDDTDQTSVGNTIKGFAWLDENENGKKDENEMILIGAQAVLIDTRTSEEVARKITNSKGEYSFKNIPDGNYVVEFRYNTNNFTVTEYTKTENSKGLSSNIVSTTQSNETIAKTEVMKLQTGEVENVNAGFVMNKKFDMSIESKINKITLSNDQGTKSYVLSDIKASELKIEEKYWKNAIILVEYYITITNVGEIEGYAKLIENQIPEGMRFSSELNTDWYEGDNGKAYSVSLSNKKIKPGESMTLKLVLTKDNMTNNKYFNMENIVKLIETSNAYLIEDNTLENNMSQEQITLINNTNKQ